MPFLPCKGGKQLKKYKNFLCRIPEMRPGKRRSSMLEYAPVCYGMPEYAQVKIKMYFSVFECKQAKYYKFIEKVFINITFMHLYTVLCT